ncbi:polyketide synthase [Paenibacillus sp. NPDC055715]
MNKVITFTQQGPIGFVAMEDKEHRNTFTDRFIYELKEMFMQIARQPSLKVIIVHGFDNYFCCGGTKDELIGLSEAISRNKDEARVLDVLNFFDTFLRCEIPVIAAMQGHAIGGGLALGCFADLLVMGEESIYNSIFMKYGFTPGMGATYIIPKKLGEALGNEMLYTAQNYYGSELKERGAPVKIVKKQYVLQVAMDMALELADKPLLTLKALKAHLNRGIKEELQDVIARENDMHRLTFGQPEVLHRIYNGFGN